MAENNTPKLEEEDYEPDIITLTDEEGQESVFEVIDALDHNDIHYMALVPYVEKEEDVSDDMDLILVKTTQEDYVDLVEDDQEWDEISRLFEKRLAEFFKIEQENGTNPPS